MNDHWLFFWVVTVGQPLRPPTHVQCLEKGNWEGRPSPLRPNEPSSETIFESGTSVVVAYDASAFDKQVAESFNFSMSFFLSAGASPLL